MVDIIVPLIQNVALLALAAFAYIAYTLEEGRVPVIARRVILGLALGLASSVVMLSPIEILPGLIFDVRAGPILLSGLVGGPVTAAVAVVPAVATRINLGGIGVWAGVAGLLVYAVCSVAASMVFQRRGLKPSFRLVVAYAIGTTILALPSILLLPDINIALTLLPTVAPILIVGNTLGVALLFVLVQLENKRRDVLDRLRESEKAATNALDVRTRFIASMSHEIRTPLNAISGYAQLLKAGEIPVTERERVTRLQIAARSLLHLIDDILEFSKLQSGSVAVRQETIEPASIISEAIEFVRQDADLKELPIEAHLHDGLPAWVRSDGDRMRQILINLLTNAVKFTPSGRVFLQCAHNADEELVLTVADTGVGIPADKLESVFLPYERIGKVRASGTGLGLTIVRTIVDSLGGRIAIESEEGVGTRVTVRLPAPRVKVDFVPSPREGPTETFAPTVSVAPVLIVEDVPMNAEVVQAFLDQAGCSSIVATNGVEAIEACRREKFSAILMDVEMPVMGGLDATRVIRSKEGPTENRDVPIIALTAFASRADSAACLAAGMNDYLMKPVDRTVLYRALEKWGVLTSIPQDEVEGTKSRDRVPDFDPNRLSDLRRAVTATRFREILAESRQATVDFVDAVAGTPRNSKVNKILLHKLVSTAGNIGLVGLSERARELETKIADQTLLDEHDGEALREIREAGTALLDEYLAGPGPGDVSIATEVANAQEVS